MANRWKSDRRKFETIVSSPLTRARRTAEIIGEALSIEVVTDEVWFEIDAGGLTGLPKEEGPIRFPKMNAFHGPFDRIAAGSGESEAQVHSRALRALDSMINFSNACLIVSHGAFLNAVIRMAFSIPVPVNRNGVLFRFGDTGYMDLAYNRDVHRWALLNFTNG